MERVPPPGLLRNHFGSLQVLCKSGSQANGRVCTLCAPNCHASGARRPREGRGRAAIARTRVSSSYYAPGSGGAKWCASRVELDVLRLRNRTGAPTGPRTHLDQSLTRWGRCGDLAVARTNTRRCFLKLHTRVVLTYCKNGCRRFRFFRLRRRGNAQTSVLRHARGRPQSCR